MESFAISPIYILIFVVLVALLMIIKLVPQGYNYTVELFGKYKRTLDPGIHFIIPLVERIGAKVNMMENFLDIPSQDVITKDNAAVHVDGVVFYQIRDARMSTYNVSNLKSSMQYLAMTNIRTVMGSMDLDELLSNRDAINSKLKIVIDEATDPWGVHVTRIEIKDIKPPRDLLDAMARQMKAEREKRARILEAEGFKEAEVTKAQGERSATILRAEGDKQEEILRAEARKEAAERDAEARERLAKAEAKATKEVSDAVANGKTEALNYFVAQKYVEAFKDIAKNKDQKTILMPYEASKILGSLGGIAEILKDTVKDKQAKTK